jgi:hypothetical protein
MLKFMSVAVLSVLLATPVTAQEAPPLSEGQTVYVPVYSHILHGNRDGRGEAQTLLLSSMLSIRNTDPDLGLTVLSVKYFDTAGKLLREYLAQPARLGPMASTDFFIENRDDKGGSGANFLVVWDAPKPLNPPIVETVNAYFFGSQSAAFTSHGRPIRTSPQVTR